eukprot:CAMPEP_0198288894 /NCGR_PEP_ID=MMETSP1449-20131203/7266_1 /TAXON_ID=420275 /ORGANISM="Attheya septentrionalis, Strain CCMP2084" /LENGTH=510 /DNA_ID=CAMNT_0043987131 /DNA_START=89 /DNA_END=1618 /DNA_ORIENTATION=+
MNLVVTLGPSPVAECFSSIRWDILRDKLRLTDEERMILKSAEENPIDYTLSSTDDSSNYARILLKVLGQASGPSGPSFQVSHVRKAVSKEEALVLLHSDDMGVITHYVVAKLYEVITCLLEKTARSSVTITSSFYSYLDGVIIDIWKPLMRILHLGGSGDAFAQRGSAVCLAYIFMAGCPSHTSGSSKMYVDYKAVEEPMQALISWITSQLQSSSSASLTLVIPTLTALMNCPEARLLFANSGGIGYLSRHMRSKNSTMVKRLKDVGPSVQQLYELCFCLWALTYECNKYPSVRSHFVRDGAVFSLVDLVAAHHREKVVRVALSSLRNLAECSSDFVPDASNRNVINGSVFAGEMIGCGLIKYVEQMRNRQWKDPDIVDDLRALNSILHRNYKDMSTWDIYQAEVESGHLEWGILHTQKFFRENAKQFEGSDGNFLLLKTLTVLASSDDEDIAGVACFDIGEFVRHYPNGRSIAKRIGTKDVIMKLIEHENEELRRHALQCVSKMLVQNW